VIDYSRYAPGNVKSKRGSRSGVDDQPPLHSRIIVSGYPPTLLLLLVTNTDNTENQKNHFSVSVFEPSGVKLLGYTCILVIFCGSDFCITTTIKEDQKHKNHIMLGFR
jgi:hypothetical protein